MIVKDKIQKKAVELLSEHKSIALEWATGCGKSLGALKIVRKIKEDNPSARGLLICKETTHKKNWEDEINKHNNLVTLDEVILYHSLHKLNGIYDYIILDECHAVTRARANKLKNIIGKDTNLIMLSATIPEEKKYLLQEISPNPIKYATISLGKAISLGVLPSPKIFVHNIKAYGKDKAMLNWYDRKISEASDRFDYKSAKIIGLKRKKHIAHLKTNRAKTVIKSIENNKERYICFSHDVAQAKELSNDYLVYSKNHNNINNALIEEFNKGERDSLFAVKMLREGINLANIDSGLIVQIDSKALSFYQMLGRCLRSDNPEMHVLVLNDSQDSVNFDKIIDNDIKKHLIYV